MAHLYYSETLSEAQCLVGATVAVEGDEARHAVRVSRLRIGESIRVGNGAGVIVTGDVTAADRDRFELSVTAVDRSPRSEIQIVLVQALAKGDRDERAVEQATEFGVDAIVPWEADRSVSRWGAEKSSRGTEKWRRIAREAAKQSVRSWVPAVHRPVRGTELVELAQKNDSVMLVLHPRGTQRISTWRASHGPHPKTMYLVVGPEGGISDSELAHCEEAGAEIVQLGSTVLRTSSAGPAALAVLNVALGRW